MLLVDSAPNPILPPPEDFDVVAKQQHQQQNHLDVSEPTQSPDSLNRESVSPGQSGFANKVEEDPQDRGVQEQQVVAVVPSPVDDTTSRVEAPPFPWPSQPPKRPTSLPTGTRTLPFARSVVPADVVLVSTNCCGLVSSSAAAVPGAVDLGGPVPNCGGIPIQPSPLTRAAPDRVTYSRYVNGSIFSVPKSWTSQKSDDFLVSLYNFFKSFLRWVRKYSCS